MSYWLAVGSTQNWNTAFEHGNIWGLRDTQRHYWERINENDVVLFYATSPVGGIIGFGVVRTKIKQNKPLWPDEFKEHQVKWPLRFEFDVEFCLSPDEWVSQKTVSKDLLPRAGFQLLSKDTAKELISKLGKAEFVVQESKPLFMAEEHAEYETTQSNIKKASSHDDIQWKLIEVGKLQNYIAEKEYPFDIGKLDVVWRRVQNSVPTYVFEVQVGGDVYHALAKLKHAFDLWNSHIYIVASDKDIEKANGLLSGTFHEINDRIKLIELDRIEELYKRKKAYFNLEKEIGI